jgi:aspartate/glutamate racemase
MHIGLIGGIGPAATVVYYQRLCDAMAARRARLELTIVQADIHELIANNLADRRAEQAAVYARLIDRLKAAGADCAAVVMELSSSRKNSRRDRRRKQGMGEPICPWKEYRPPSG